MKLRRSGTERIQFWESGGLGRLPKLRVATVKSSFSAVPEKPMGLYDPSFDKDSCGVGFVAELNGQSNRKTVREFLYTIFHVL
jgi:glutamate synthase (NADPH/NADH)